MGRPKGSQNARPPKYSLHKGSGRGVVYLPGSSRPTYLDGKHGSPESRSHYHRLMSTLAANNGIMPATHDANGPTVSELIAAYFTKHVMVSFGSDEPRHYSKRTNIRSVLSELNEMYGPTRAKDFGTDGFLVIRETLMRRGSRYGTPYNRETLNRKLWWIKDMFKWGAPRKLVPSSIFHDLMTVDPLPAYAAGGLVKENKVVKAVDPAHVAATIPFLPETVWRAIKLQHLTSMRSTELLIMRGVDIDTMPTSQAARDACRDCGPDGPCNDHASWIYRPTAFKGKFRDPEYVKEIPIGPLAQEIIRPLLKPDLQAFLFDPYDGYRAGARNSDKKPRMVRRRPHRPGSRRPLKQHYTSESYWHAIRRACDKADTKAHAEQPDVPAETRLVPRWFPHQLRHLRASEVEALFDEETASATLDHRKARKVAAAIG
jgi:hypothetical protein